MPNYKLVLEYHGKRFSGYQVQPGKRTVQSEIERAAQEFFCRKVTVLSSGRTDSGVHSRHHVISFKCPVNRSPESVRKGFNSKLPADIAVVSASIVPDSFDAGRSARSKTYRYRVFTASSRPVIDSDTTYWCPFKLDMNLMRAEAKDLTGRHDFKGFESAGSPRKTTVRTLFDVSIKKSGDIVNIDITADGFLYNMARNIAGTLIDIGRGKLEPGTAAEVLRTGDSVLRGFTAPAKGLTLLKVEY